jgi:16S rRNA (uracil1498-N3)-methyltransferase
MQRLFINAKIYINATLPTSIDIAHYIVNVIKLKDGQHIHIFNEHDGEWLAQIQIQSKKNIILLVQEQIRKKKIQKFNLTLAFSLLKKQNNSLIITKATELNVEEIHPIITDRSIVREINLERYNKIAIEAAEQCGRLSVPKIHEAISLKKLLLKKEKSHIIICNNQQPSPHISTVLQKINMQEETIIITGPEGGFSNAEIATLEGNRLLHHAGLGDLILRAETACIFSLSAYNIIYNLPK